MCLACKMRPGLTQCHMPNIFQAEALTWGHRVFECFHAELRVLNRGEVFICFLWVTLDAPFGGTRSPWVVLVFFLTYIHTKWAEQETSIKPG